MSVYSRFETAQDEDGNYLFGLSPGDWVSRRIEREGRQIVRFHAYNDRKVGGAVDYDPATRQCAVVDGPWQDFALVPDLLGATSRGDVIDYDTLRKQSEAAAALAKAEMATNTGSPPTIVREEWQPGDSSTRDHYTLTFDVPGIIIKVDKEEMRMAVYETEMAAIDDHGNFLFGLPSGDWRTSTIARDGRQVVRFELPLGFWNCDRYLDYDPAKREGAFSDGGWRSGADIGAMLQLLVEESQRNSDRVAEGHEAAARAAKMTEVPIPTAAQQTGQPATKRRVWPNVLRGSAVAIFALLLFFLLLGWLATVNNW
jgi:hypothetical protein